MRGATGGGLGQAAGVQISIHAPHAGRDGMIWDSWDSSNEFQSTRPMRGATEVLTMRLIDVDISIHAPHAGRDK